MRNFECKKGIVMTQKADSRRAKEAEVCQQLGVDDIEKLDKRQRAIVRALANVENAAEKGAEEGFVTKEQLEQDLRESLTEVFKALQEGRKLKTVEELLAEL